MNIVIRVDASVQMGTGHLMRCLTLAEEVRGLGATIHFISHGLPGSLPESIQEKGCHLHTLSGEEESEEKEGTAHAHWLPVSWQNDARQTQEILEQIGEIDWIIIDHYALDKQWESAIRPVVSHIMVIDDLADRSHDCDILLDQNLYENPHERYTDLLPEHCTTLLGPEYALLREEFQRERTKLCPRDGSVHTVLIFLGGSDPANITKKALQAALEYKELSIELVTGGANPHREELERLCAMAPNVRYHSQTNSIAHLMAHADLAIGAGGTATWERCCLGLPTLTVVIAENQRELVETAVRKGLCIRLPDYDVVTIEDIDQALEASLQHKEILLAVSENSLKIVDGKGSKRVGDYLMKAIQIEKVHVKASDLCLRRAVGQDMTTYFQWANDRNVRQNSFNPEAIMLENHSQWFTNRLNNPYTYLYILEYKGKAAGQIRFDIHDGAAEIDFSIDEAMRGKGLGTYLLQQGILCFRSDTTGNIQILGTVKKSNTASCKAFLNAGFIMQEEIERQGDPCVIYCWNE